MKKVILTISILFLLAAPTKYIQAQDLPVSIILQVGKQETSVNGKEFLINTPPKIYNETTYLPLMFVADVFEIETSWNEESQLLTMKNKEIDLEINLSDNKGTGPIMQDNIIIVPIKYVADLFSLEIDYNPSNKKIHLYDKKSRQDNFVEEVITRPISENPKITELISYKETWSQGEDLRLSYKADIVDGEKILRERWTYKHEGEDRVFTGKPRALFEEGDYTVSLELKDSNRNWSEPKDLKIKIGEDKITTELDYKFNSLIPGENFDNFSKYNFQNYGVVEDYSITNNNMTLLFSNSPETIRQKGILYSDKVKGPTRIVYHHRNGLANSSTDLRLLVIAENQSNNNITLDNIQNSNMGPSKDILHLGQAVSYDFLNNTKRSSVVVPANGERLIYDTGNTRWPNLESLSGIIEFTSSKPIQITIAAVSKDFKIESLKKVPILNRDGVHTRGTFLNANKHYDINLATNKPSKISFGQNDGQMDQWLKGYDSLTKDIVYNKGNYGVLYTMDIDANEKVGVILNPRATSFKGAFKWNNEKAYKAPNNGILVGSGQSAIAGVVNGGSSRQLLYSLSSGSSAPVLFNFIPERLWKNYEFEIEK